MGKIAHGRTPFRSISPQDASHLERPFLVDEIKSTLRDLSDDRAPSPDGFPIAFFHIFWDVVKEDLIAFI